LLRTIPLLNRTCIGIRCKDGVILGVEKLIHSKLLVKGANRRIATVDEHYGVVRLGFPKFAVSVKSQLDPCCDVLGYCGPPG